MSSDKSDFFKNKKQGQKIQDGVNRKIESVLERFARRNRKLKLKAPIRDTPLDSALSLSASAERQKYLHGQRKNLPLRNKLKRRRRADNDNNENRRHSARRRDYFRTCKQSDAETEIETG